MIVKGGSFSKNCNDGFKLVKTKAVVFLNDDTRIDDAELLFSNMMKMLETKHIVGCKVRDGLSGFNIVKKELIAVNNTVDKVEFPAGHCLMMKCSTYKKLGGFDEGFVNGGEDIDLFMKAYVNKMKLGIVNDVMEHMEHQSEGRFYNLMDNVKLFNKRWGKKALALCIPSEEMKKNQHNKKQAWIEL